MQKKRNTKRCKDKKKLPTTSRDNGISIIFQEKEREREVRVHRHWKSLFLL